MTDLPEFKPEDIVETEVIEHPPAVIGRSVARRLALQVLYEVDSTQHRVGEALAWRLQEEPVNRKTERYLQMLVKGVTDYRDRIDTVIRRYAQEFPLEQVAFVDRNILRMAVYELAVQVNTPISVVIAEATELANIYGADSAIRFVNGVLGALASDLENNIAEQLIPSDNTVE